MGDRCDLLMSVGLPKSMCSEQSVIAASALTIEQTAGPSGAGAGSNHQ